MAEDTPLNTRNLVIYEIFVRNHGRHGTFADVTADLPRIRAMGVDVIWFMPIYPIGQKNRKGTLGSPYAIQNYREVNPELGTKEEFRLLCQYAHALGLKVIIDVVYNHTAPDSVLVNEHPEWFYKDENGRLAPTNPVWSDVVDLVYADPALWDYQIETLRQWVELGVDGFRCDVAAAVPLPFWQRAREELAHIKPNLLWLAESVHTAYLLQRRQQGLVAHADSELFAAFDLAYDYDIWPLWEKAVHDPKGVLPYLTALWYQKGIYPAHAVKMRCVENHDQPRIMKRAPTRAQALAWTAFQAFNEGAFLIYAGQESESVHTPDLFEPDRIKWGSYSLQPFLTELCQLKKHPIVQQGHFTVLRGTPAISALWQAEKEGLFGVFNVSGVVDVQPTPLTNGRYTDLLSGFPVEVRDGQMAVPDSAVILRYPGRIDPTPHIQPHIIP
ncbi:MAG: alpha-amylase [Chloroflexi bacterium]|nr:MAG: alpha-amylase [Chloroflexota bacterium]